MSEAVSFHEQVDLLGHEGTAFVFVALVESLGSTPQETGAKMLVTATGLRTGTIGDGKGDCPGAGDARQWSGPRLESIP